MSADFTSDSKQLINDISAHDFGFERRKISQR